jgi:hypothetical protein
LFTDVEKPFISLSLSLSLYDGAQSYDMIYLLTAIGLSPGDSSTVHIYTQTIHRMIQNSQYIEQHNNWRVRAVARLGYLYPGIWLTTEEKARKNSVRVEKNLTQGRKTSVRVEKPQSG